MKKLIFYLCAFTLLLVISAFVFVEARPVKQPRGQQQQQQAPRPPQGGEPLDPLLGSPVLPLTTVEEFQQNVMSSTMPVLMFIGNSKTTKQQLRDNVTSAAVALDRHVILYYVDLASNGGKEFVQSLGIPQTDDTPRILLWQPEFIKQGTDGWAKHPAQYTGSTTPFGITRWFLAMVSRKHLDIIEDVQDLVTFKAKYKQFSLPKVILVTASNFTSPMFVSVGHQYRYLSHFGVIKGVTRKSYDSAMEIFEKEEQELKKGLGLDNDKQDSSTATASSGARHFQTDFTIHDESEEEKENAGYQNEEKKNAAHAELLHVLGVQSVPCVITASADLGDVEVHPARNMTMTQLQDIISQHALPQDQLKALLGQILEADHQQEQENTKIAREQKKNKKAGSTSSSNDEDGSAEKKAADLSAFKPIWVKDMKKEWKQHCPEKPSGTLCIAVFSEDIQNNILKYDAKIEELAKGIQKTQLRNRHGFSSVKLLLFENSEQTLKLAKLWNAADGMFPAVVFVNPSKGTFYNHIGSFTGASLSEFVLARMKQLRAKTYNKEQAAKDFFGAAAEKPKQEEKKQQQQQKANPKFASEAERERAELEDAINAEDL